MGNDTNFVLHFPTFPVKMTFCYLIIQLKTFFPQLKMNELTPTSFLTLTYHSEVIVQNGHKKANKNVNSKTPTAIRQKNIFHVVSFALNFILKFKFKLGC